MKNFLRTNNRLHKKIGSYVMPENRSIEIDDIHEFKFAEKLQKINI